MKNRIESHRRNQIESKKRKIKRTNLFISRVLWFEDMGAIGAQSKSCDACVKPEITIQTFPQNRILKSRESRVNNTRNRCDFVPEKWVHPVLCFLGLIHFVYWDDVSLSSTLFPFSPQPTYRFEAKEKRVSR